MTTSFPGELQPHPLTLLGRGSRALGSGPGSGVPRQFQGRGSWLLFASNYRLKMQTFQAAQSKESKAGK